ncbi:hypothetical protein ACQJBY_066066 [Aegilops geniculata]
MDGNAEADSTLVFDKETLDKVYEKVAPSIVKVLLKPFSTGFVVSSTEKHNMVAVCSMLLIECKEKIRVRYSDGDTAVVDHTEKVSNSDMTILYARKTGKARPAVQFGVLEDIVCQKIVSLFPYKDGLMMFKGHIGLDDCTCEDSSGNIIPGQNIFSFTCPVGGSYSKDPDTDSDIKRRFMILTIGAPVFNLDGEVPGMIDSFSRSYDLKFARKSSEFRDELNKPGRVNWQLRSKKKLGSWHSTVGGRAVR